MFVISQKTTRLIVLFSLATAIACNNAGSGNAVTPDGSVPAVVYYGAPVLDGSASDEVWDQCEWLPINTIWEGDKPSDKDFSGQYKVLWDENNLYIIAEIQDDTLIDIHPDGLEKYWDDDCFVVVVDEDASGGRHDYSYNAFAYHIGLDARVVDVAPDSSFQFFDDHCVSRRSTTGNSSVWEIAVKLHDGNTYQDGNENIPKLLQSGKKLRFAVAYCDNDYAVKRENLIGSCPVPAPGTVNPLVDASLLSLLELQ